MVFLSFGLVDESWILLGGLMDMLCFGLDSSVYRLIDGSYEAWNWSWGLGIDLV